MARLIASGKVKTADISAMGASLSVYMCMCMHIFVYVCIYAVHVLRGSMVENGQSAAKSWRVCGGADTRLILWLVHG